MDVRLLTAEDELTEHVQAWDALADAAGLPYCSPHWMIPWWRERAPADSELRVLVVYEEGRLDAVFPWYRENTRSQPRVWRQLCAGFCSRLAPVALPGAEARVASAAAQRLAAEDLDILALEALPGGSLWPTELRRSWISRTRPFMHSDLTMQAPVAQLTADFDAWLARRGRTVRSEVPRRRRRLLDHGVVPRLAEPPELEWAIGHLCRLYRSRWEWRGGSDRLATGLERLLLSAATALAGRFQLWLLDREEAEPVGAYLFVQAGSHLSDWGGGFDEEWARYSPTYVLRLCALEHAAASGVERVDFAEGTQRDKLHFSDGTELIDWVTLVPHGKGYLRARADLFPKHVRWRARAVARRLPKPVRQQLRRITGRPLES